ncbi:MAG: hypothetical protein OXH09_21490 [Gammaproteobacteria bacterium]|nr:hypothetical protein [Gammaproteobacteria bacterium]
MVHDDIGHGDRSFNVSVATAIALVRKTTQPFRDITLAVVLDIDVVLLELFAQVHRESCCDAPLAQIVLKQMAIVFPQPP